MDSNPKISVLIATDDHPPDLDLMFDGLIRQTVPPDDYECIVIDSTHTHEFMPAYERALQRKHASLRLVYERSRKGGRACAYNHGLPLCRAPVILFLGDDNLAKPPTVEAHLQFHGEHSERHVVGVGSALFPAEYRNHFSIWSEQSGELFGVPFHEDTDSVPDYFFYIGNTSIKRGFLLQAGPFDERFQFHAWDDYEIGLRLSALGMKSMFVPGATAEHHHDVTLQERCRLIVEAGQSAAAFDCKYAEAHPWHKKCRISPWRHHAAALWFLLRYRLRRADRDIFAYYRKRLDAAFVTGYRMAGGSAPRRQLSTDR